MSVGSEKPVAHINIDVDVEELVQDKRGMATQHICSMQFADVAFALKTQTAKKTENTQLPVEKSAAE